jgi:hypothetical protein
MHHVDTKRAYGYSVQHRGQLPDNDKLDTRVQKRPEQVAKIIVDHSAPGSRESG